MNQKVFASFQRTQIAELRPYNEGEDVSSISISAEDAAMGSPKSGDRIARNPANHADQWLVAAKYFADNFAPMDQGEPDHQDKPRSSDVHPGPAEFSHTQLSENPILRFFHYRHLPDRLRETSEKFCALARVIVESLPRNAERTVALRKLLEAKDAAVRAHLAS